MKKLKTLLLIFMVSSMTLLSSCLFPGPEHGSHGGGKEYHGQQKHHGNNGHHDKDDHHEK